MRGIRRDLTKHFDIREADWEWAYDHVDPTHDSRNHLFASRSNSDIREAVAMTLDKDEHVTEDDLAVILGANRRVAEGYSSKYLERGFSPPITIKATGHTVSFMLEGGPVTDLPLTEKLLHHKLTKRGYVTCEAQHDPNMSENVHFEGASELAKILLARKPYSGSPEEAYWSPGQREPFAQKGVSGYLNINHIF